MRYFEDDLGVLYCGDARDILPGLDMDSVDMAMTSPPYWKARKYSGGNELGQEPNYRWYIDNVCYILQYVKIPLKPEGSLFVNIGDKWHRGILVDIPGRFAATMIDTYIWRLKHRIIWHKPNAFPTSNAKKFTIDYEFVYHFVQDVGKYYFKQQFEPSTQSTQEQYRNILRTDKENLKEPYQANAPRAYRHDKVRQTSQPSPNRMWEDDESLKRQLERGRNKRSVWSIPIGTEKATTSHIATYPRELCRTPILATCPPDGVVLDPFMGSGTTAIMAEELGRRWIGIEIKEEYCKEAVRRIIRCRK